jgi:hypothetical protein
MKVSVGIFYYCLPLLDGSARLPIFPSSDMIGSDLPSETPICKLIYLAYDDLDGEVLRIFLNGVPNMFPCAQCSKLIGHPDRCIPQPQKSGEKATANPLWCGFGA